MNDMGINVATGALFVVLATIVCCLVELVDTPHSKCGAARRPGSSPGGAKT
jgi:hypothetical protein